MNKIIELLFNMLIIVAFILVSYMILLKLAGHSLTLSQVNTTIIFVLLGLSLRTQYNLGKLSAHAEHNQRNIKELRQDVKNFRNEIKQDFRELNQKIDKLAYS